MQKGLRKRELPSWILIVTCGRPPKPTPACHDSSAFNWSAIRNSSAERLNFSAIFRDSYGVKFTITMTRFRQLAKLHHQKCCRHVLLVLCTAILPIQQELMPKVLEISLNVGNFKELERARRYNDARHFNACKRVGGEYSERITASSSAPTTQSQSYRWTPLLHLSCTFSSSWCFFFSLWSSYPF